MSISTFASWKTKLDTGYQFINAGVASVRTVNLAGRLGSLFTDTGGSAPGAAAVPTNTTAGGFLQGDPAGTLRLARAVVGDSVGANIGGMLMLVDRLSHQSGLSGTTTGAQTTNLPTAALTRYTSGVGVWPCLEIYSAVGTTGTTATCSYTNQGGTSGRTSQAVQFGGSGFNGQTQIFPFGLQSGDYGCQAVASVTIAASTLTAGNFGVTLIKPLAIVPVQIAPSLMFDGDALISMLTPVEILTEACLQWLFSLNSNSNPNVTGILQLIED